MGLSLRPDARNLDQLIVTRVRNLGHSKRAKMRHLFRATENRPHLIQLYVTVQLYSVLLLIVYRTVGKVEPTVHA